MSINLIVIVVCWLDVFYLDIFCQIREIRHWFIHVVFHVNILYVAESFLKILQLAVH